MKVLGNSSCCCQRVAFMLSLLWGQVLPSSQCSGRLLGLWAPSPIIAAVMEEGKKLVMYVSMYLHFSGWWASQRVMHWGIGMGMRTKQNSWEKNISRQSLVLSKHCSLSKRLCCPGPCVLTLQHTPELRGAEGIRVCQGTSLWDWPPVSLCCACACTRCPQVPFELLQDRYV